MAADYKSLPFEEAIDFLRGKVNLPTDHWDDLWRQQHGRAFMVAGAKVEGLLEDFRGAVDAAIADGESLEQFRARFDGIVKKHGWSHTGAPAWRSEVIYSTNVRAAYQAGRYAQMTSPASRAALPFWEYRHQDSAHPRPLHVSWHGKILRADDPWWKAHYPANGWGCKCRAFPLSARQLAKMGREVDVAPDDGAYEWTDRYGEVHTIPNGIDPGFDYAPDREWSRSVAPALRDVPLVEKGIPPAEPLPTPRKSTRRPLPKGQSPERYARAFLDAAGAQEGDAPTFFEDVTGGMVVLSDELFRAPSGEWKILKRGREQYVELLADTLTAPDEVWLHFHKEPEGRYRMYKTFVAQWQMEEATSPLFVLLRWGRDAWGGETAFQADAGYLERQRFGKRVYRRGE